MLLANCCISVTVVGILRHKMPAHMPTCNVVGHTGAEGRGKYGTGKCAGLEVDGPTAWEISQDVNFVLFKFVAVSSV